MEDVSVGEAKSRMTPTLHIQLLGDLYLRHGDVPVATLQSPQEQSLLAYLLLHRGAPQSRQHLSFLFWPDSTEAQARGQLRKLLYRLRQDLPGADAYLHTDTHTVQWLSAVPFTLDVAAYERALARADEEEASGHRTEAIAALERAVALYVGDLLPSCYDDWILQERARLSQRFVHALERLQAFLEGQRAYDRAIQYAQRLLRHDPLHEPCYRALMRLYALTGNRASALRVYHECVTVLERELDVAPGLDTRQAYERLLRSGALAAPPTSPATELAASSPLVGRDSEWAQLLDCWQDAVAGTPQLVLIEGEAGIGKTRMAEELVRWTQRQGASTATARCYAAEGTLAYAPVAQWLRARPLPPLEPVWRQELARLLPELLAEDADLAPPGPMTEAWQRQRLFESLARAVLGDKKPLLLLLDDVQWCDQSTLEWLHYLLRFDPRAQLLVIGTLRLEEVRDDHPLSKWLRAARRAVPLNEIALGPLDEAETVALATNVSGRTLDADLAACIHAETEGNPLFVVEMVRAGRLVDEREPDCPPQGLPPRVQATIEGRLAQLSPSAQELVGLAAVVGREFTFAVLAEASDLDQNALLRALDELWARRVVREQGGEGYDFSHDKLRQVAYARLGEVRRRHLHRRVAGALEAVFAADLGPASGQVAVHYERAGEVERALPYYLRAAEHARQVYANEPAMGHYERVLALTAPSGTGEKAEWRLQALGGLGQVHLPMGRLPEAEDQFRAAIALGKAIASPPRQIVRLYYWLGQALYQQSRYGEQIRVGEEGLALLGKEHESIEAVLILDTIATGYHNIGNRERARDLWYRAAAFVEHLPYVEELGTIYQVIFSLYLWNKQVDEAMRWLHVLETKIAADPDERAQGIIHKQKEAVLAGKGDIQGAIAHLQQALACTTRTGNVIEREFYLWRLSYRSLSLGDVPKAEEYARASLELKWIIGPRYHYFAWGHWLLGLILLCRGIGDKATEALEQAIAHAQETDHPELDLGANQILGRMYLERGERAAAWQRYRLAAALSTPKTFRNWRASLMRPYALAFTSVLSGLEEAQADPQAFRTFCRQFPGRERFVAGAEQSPDLAQFALVQWLLEAATPAQPARLLLHETFGAPPSPAWTWHDPFGDCRYALQEGLEIHAANGRDLWHINWSAPRLLRPLSSTSVPAANPAAAGFAVQTICVPASREKLAMGGLLLWIDQANYLRLNRGMDGSHEMIFLGCVDGQDLVIGRGAAAVSLPSHRPTRRQMPPWSAPTCGWSGSTDRSGRCAARTGKRGSPSATVPFPLTHARSSACTPSATSTALSTTAPTPMGRRSALGRFSAGRWRAQCRDCERRFRRVQHCREH
jgi:predicted ATPase